MLRDGESVAGSDGAVDVVGVVVGIFTGAPRLRSQPPGLVVEPCCPGILLDDDGFLSFLVGHGRMIGAGGVGCRAARRSAPRHARHTSLGHSPGEEIVGLITTGDGVRAVGVHHRSARPGPSAGRELISSSTRRYRPHPKWSTRRCPQPRIDVPSWWTVHLLEAHQGVRAGNA